MHIPDFIYRLFTYGMFGKKTFFWFFEECIKQIGKCSLAETTLTVHCTLFIVNVNVTTEPVLSPGRVMIFIL